MKTGEKQAKVRNEKGEVRKEQMSRPGVKLTLGDESEKGIYNLQRSVQDASCRGDSTRQICHDIAGAKSLWHLRGGHDSEVDQKILQGGITAKTSEGGNDDRDRRIEGSEKEDTRFGKSAL